MISVIIEHKKILLLILCFSYLNVKDNKTKNKGKE